MFDRFMTLINKIRALGDKYWDDNMAARKMCRVYRQKNNLLASVIMERDNYTTMTPQEMLAKLKHHEVLEDEAKEATGQKKSVALNASISCGSSGCNKKHEHEASSDIEHEEDSDEEHAMLVRNFRRFLKKKKERMSKGGPSKPYKKRFCYGCGDIGHFIADCPNKNMKQKKYDNKKYKGKKSGEAHLGEEWDSNDESEDEDKGKKGVASIAIQETSPTIINKASSTTLFTDVSSSPRLFSNLTDNDYYTPRCLMAKGDKVPPNSPTKFSDDDDSCDENNDDFAKNLIKKYGKVVASKILKLIYKVEKREGCIESQGELLLVEREKSQGLEAKEKEKVEKLNVELSLAKDSYERMSKEHSLLNDSLASLKNEHSLVQESLTSLKDKYHELELNYDSLWNSTSNLPKGFNDSNASTSEGCKRCYNVDINACATNFVELEKKDKEINRLNMIIKNGCKCNEKQPTTMYKASRHPFIKDGIGYNRYVGKANGRNMVNRVSCVNFNKGVVLDDILNKVNNVTTPHSWLANNKNNKKKQVEVPKQQVPISKNHACDYMCCWGKDGKIVVKYVGALKKKKILRSVWVPKAYVTNPLGPKSNWVPKTKA
jgi:hypothetical protein